ncbi:hypothetical protein BpOF4_05550 [Alkalihalophilus pseudofirmus OF4]|uniref:Holin-like toxin n=2 Tax=Alkalihalophilus TaxID=2893060 RepID=D3FYE9_ALKPO|nr:hypothetical protein BpOF4_05550 [Alkalihalophilus pseudofirmus OF4]ERN52129.1 hypothetical protein A33I_17825 [Alkalihalophilus marmarensis DSM 21297]
MLITTYEALSLSAQMIVVLVSVLGLVITIVVELNKKK